MCPNTEKAEADTCLRSSLSKKHSIEDYMASSRGEHEQEDVAAAEPPADPDAMEVED